MRPYGVYYVPFGGTQVACTPMQFPDPYPLTCGWNYPTSPAAVCQAMDDQVNDNDKSSSGGFSACPVPANNLAEYDPDWAITSGMWSNQNHKYQTTQFSKGDIANQWAGLPGPWDYAAYADMGWEKQKIDQIENILRPQNEPAYDIADQLILATQGFYLFNNPDTWVYGVTMNVTNPTTAEVDSWWGSPLAAKWGVFAFMCLTSNLTTSVLGKPRFINWGSQLFVFDPKDP